MNVSALALGLAAAILLVGCGAQIQDVGEEHLPHALRSHVKLKSEPRPDKANPVLYTVVLRGKVFDIDRNDSGVRMWRIGVRTITGKTEALFITLAPLLTLPFSVGDNVSVHFFSRWDRSAGVSRRGLAINGTGEVPLLVYQDHEVLPASYFPSGLTVTPEDRVEYVEVSRPRSLCYTVVEHRRVALRYDETTASLPPGTVKRVTLAGSDWTVGIIDNAVTQLDRSECPDYRPDRVAWFAVRVAD